MSNLNNGRTAAEIIGFHLGMDINDVKEYRYQPTVYRNPAIYGIDFKHAGKEWAYVCSPARGSIPKGDLYGHFEWEKIGEEFGRAIYGSEGK